MHKITLTIPPIKIGKIDNTNNNILAVGYDRYGQLLVIVTENETIANQTTFLTIGELKKFLPLGLNLNQKEINKLQT